MTGAPNNPDGNKGFDGQPPAVHAAYVDRARAFLNAKDMNKYATKLKRDAARIEDTTRVDPTDNNTPPRQRGFG